MSDFQQPLTDFEKQTLHWLKEIAKGIGWIIGILILILGMLIFR